MPYTRRFVHRSLVNLLLHSVQRSEHSIVDEGCGDATIFGANRLVQSAIARLVFVA